MAVPVLCDRGHGFHVPSGLHTTVNGAEHYDGGFTRRYAVEEALREHSLCTRYEGNPHAEWQLLTQSYCVVSMYFVSSE
jgi:hypothetical protein